MLIRELLQLSQLNDRHFTGQLLKVPDKITQGYLIRLASLRPSYRHLRIP